MSAAIAPVSLSAFSRRGINEFLKSNFSSPLRYRERPLVVSGRFHVPPIVGDKCFRCWNSCLPVRCCSSQASSVVTTSDEYGHKQVISLTPRLYDYVLNHVREPKILRKIREETATLRGSQMQGYSSLAIALVLPESGSLVACERDAKSLEIARRYYEEAGVLHKVRLHHGLAKDCLESLLLYGEAASYDFAFIDAEKKMYPEYYELLLQLVRAGGLVVIDNVLWHGKVADPLVNDAKTVSIRNFNKFIIEDERVDVSMVPIGDGMTVCRIR